MPSPSDPPSSNPLGAHLLAAARQEHSSSAGEDSAMFTLDRLMAGTDAASTTLGDSPEEDSGLIDLGALARGASALPKATTAASWLDAGHFPLGEPSHGAAEPAVPMPAPRPSSAGRLLLYGLALVALLLTAAVAFLLARGPRPVADLAVERPAPPAATERTPAADLPDDSTTSMPEATVTTAASAPPSPAPSPRPSRPTPPRAARAQPAPPQPSSSPAVQRDEGCRCPPDDLDCHMHCSVRQRR